MTKVLVVGGAGYIGGAVTDILLARQVPFTVYDSLLYEPHYLKPVDFIRGDVRDTDLLKKVLPSYTHVIWLAAIVGDGACAVTPDLTTAVNMESVRWLSENYNGRIVFTSTCSVYGEHDGMVDEDGVTGPLSLYAETKLQAESFLLDRGNALIFRLGTAFGLSDTYSRPRMDLVANLMPVAALTKGVITLNGGNQWRPMIHVKDIAYAAVSNLARPVRGLYNLASVNLQIKDLARTCADITGCEIKTIPMSGTDTRDYRANIQKAIRDGIFNINATYTIEDCVREFADLVRSGRIKQMENSLYFNVRHIGELKEHGKYA
jgi:nucleoside-diphosphate-sugar epimerase